MLLTRFKLEGNHYLARRDRTGTSELPVFVSGSVECDRKVKKKKRWLRAELGTRYWSWVFCKKKVVALVAYTTFRFDKIRLRGYCIFVSCVPWVFLAFYGTHIRSLLQSSKRQLWVYKSGSCCYFRNEILFLNWSGHPETDLFSSIHRFVSCKI